MFEPIEKLREMDDQLIALGNGQYTNDHRHNAIANEIEAEIAELQASWAQEAREHADDAGRIADLAAENERLKREIAERYIELPLDADGVPIRIGDTVIEVDDTVSCKVMSLHLYDDGCWDVNTVGMNPNLLRHDKKQDIEDLLERFIEDYDHWDEFAHFGRSESRNALFARYADEIRKVVGE